MHLTSTEQLMLLQCLPQTGVAAYWRLLDQFASLSSVFESSQEQLKGLLHERALESVLAIQKQGENHPFVQKVKADIASLESALEMYSLDMYSYPDPAAGLFALTTAPANASANYRPGGYIKRLRPDPWGNDYQYITPGARSGTAFDLFSAGPDGEPGTGDDIGNWG